MRISNKLLSVVLCTTALASFSAQAKENNNYYIQLNGGLASGLAPKGDIADKKMGRSGLVGAEAGYQYNENLRASVSLDYLTGFSFKENFAADNTDPDATAAAQNNNYKVKSLVSMLNLYYDIMEIKGFTPYVTVGAGIARNKTTLTNAVYGDEGTATTLVKGTRTNFAYKAGFGTKYSITQAISLDARYQFMNLGKIKTNPAGQVEDTLKGKLRAHTVVVGVSYKF
jgi:opacity protein-like surface antigen